MDRGRTERGKGGNSERQEMRVGRRVWEGEADYSPR
jgi:hypothetical protein